MPAISALSSSISALARALAAAYPAPALAADDTNVPTTPTALFAHACAPAAMYVAAGYKTPTGATTLAATAAMRVDDADARGGWTSAATSIAPRTSATVRHGLVASPRSCCCCCCC